MQEPDSYVQTILYREHFHLAKYLYVREYFMLSKPLELLASNQ